MANIKELCVSVSESLPNLVRAHVANQAYSLHLGQLQEQLPREEDGCGCTVRGRCKADVEPNAELRLTLPIHHFLDATRVHTILLHYEAYSNSPRHA